MRSNGECAGVGSDSGECAGVRSNGECVGVRSDSGECPCIRNDVRE